MKMNRTAKTRSSNVGQMLLLLLLKVLLFASTFDNAESGRLLLVSADLREVWNFSAPALRAPELDPNGLRISMQYNVSDYITQEMVFFNVKDWECETNVSQWFIPTLSLPTADFIQGDGTGDGVIQVDVHVDPDSFENAPDEVAKYWENQAQEKYRVMVSQSWF